MRVLMKHIRNCAKALIIRDRQVLLIEKRVGDANWFVFPGGGQERGETLEEALQRECMEEIGTHVVVGPLRFVREYVGSKHEFGDSHQDRHHVELLFLCDVPDDYQPRMGEAPDEEQIRVDWIPLENLNEEPVFPRTLAKAIAQGDLSNLDVYWGDVN